MSIPEEVMNELQSLPDAMQREVLDFARFLRVKEEAALDKEMDDLITENLVAFKELAK